MASMGRFRRRAGGGKRLHPAAIVGICLAAAILLTVTVGNLLKIWLDDETFGDMTATTETPPPVAAPVGNGAPVINAPLYALGGRVDDFVGYRAVTVSVNSTDGTMRYRSDVTEYFALPTVQSAPRLSDGMSALTASIPYVSGVFTSSALAHESYDVRYAAMLREAAVLQEFYRAGASELVIRGLPLETLTADEVREYVSTIRMDAANLRVGIAVPLSVAESPNGWWILSAMWDCADFFVLDLGAEELPADGDVPEAVTLLLGRTHYYLSQYGMRLMASDGQRALVEEIERKNYSNYQITAAN